MKTDTTKNTVKTTAKAIAIHFVEQLAPDSLDLVDSEFDVFYDRKVGSLGEGSRFDFSGDTIALAAALIASITAIFSEAAKDAAKAALAKTLTKWFAKKTLTPEEIASIVSAFDSEGKRLGISEKERVKTAAAVKQLLEKDAKGIIKNK